MSGANESPVTAAQQRGEGVAAEPAGGNTQSDAQPPSLPPAVTSGPGESESATVTSASRTVTAGNEAKDTTKEGDRQPADSEAAVPSTEAGSTAVAAESSSTAAPQAPKPPPPAVTRGRSDSLSINPYDEAVGSSPATGTDGHLICNITLLLPTGARHPFRIDERYLAKRNVDVPGVTESGKKDPFSISVYKLKELILREWRDDWDGKPASPSSIRLIHFGKLLEDKEQLKKYHFSAEAPNVVHMSVKPPEMMEEDEAAKGKSGGRESRTRESNSGCCVIL